MVHLVDAYFERLKNTLDSLNREEIIVFLDILKTTRDRGGHIFIMGNGGSASTASHFVCDFNKGASYGKEKRFKVICLNDSMSTLSAYSNDIHYEEAFVEQLKNFLTKDDLVIGISCSGNSKNVLKAMEYAKTMGAVTVAWTGFDGGQLKKMAQYSVNVPIKDMQISEDVHMILNHLFLHLVGQSYA